MLITRSGLSLPIKATTSWRDQPAGANDPGWRVEYGNGLRFYLSELCGGYGLTGSDCPAWSTPDSLFTPFVDMDGRTAYKVKDAQGLWELKYYGRQHALQLPRHLDTPSGFIPSS